jgi:hypothetical protein
MKTKIYVSLACIFLLFSGCDKIRLDQVTNCHIGTNYKVSKDLSFIINSVSDHRRSPKGGVNEGYLYANFSIKSKGNMIDTALYLNYTKLPPNYEFGEYEIGLYGVDPITDGESTSKNITITVFVSKL